MKLSTKGRISMNQRIVNVKLSTLNNDDVLIFYLEDEAQQQYFVNLNDSNNQSEMKIVFTKLLELLLDYDIVLNLVFDDNYNKGLYKDVCTEYINDLNREIKQVKETIHKEFK